MTRKGGAMSEKVETKRTAKQSTLLEQKSEGYFTVKDYKPLPSSDEDIEQFTRLMIRKSAGLEEE